MQSAGSSENSPEPPSPGVAQLVGMFVALLTVTLPLFAIAYYSSSSSLQMLPTYPLSQTRE